MYHEIPTARFVNWMLSLTNALKCSLKFSCLKHSFLKTKYALVGFQQSHSIFTEAFSKLFTSWVFLIGKEINSKFLVYQY